MTHHPASNETQRATPFFSRSHTSNIRAYAQKRRWWLGLGASLLFAVMVVGILFAAHKHYVSFGGQGWLKVRTPLPDLTQWSEPVVLRSLKLTNSEAEEWAAPRLTKRLPVNVPYYPCGDQKHSCEAHNQPNICCPVKTFCYPSPFTNSQIFCCNGTSASECDSSKFNPPACEGDTHECSRNTGGGCCPLGAICAPNGCIEIVKPYIIDSSQALQPISGSRVDISTVYDTSSTSLEAAETTTVTERPAATITAMKEGEVAQIQKGQEDSVMLTLSLPYLSTWALVCVAGIMGFL